MHNLTSLRVVQIKFLILGRAEDLSKEVTFGLRAVCQEAPNHSGRENSKC